MWFKNLRIYRLDPQWQCDRASLEKALSSQVFNPQSASASEMQRLGWVPAVGDQELVYANDGQFLITLRSEKKLLPASVVNQFAAEKAREIEEQQGYRPGRRQMKEIKEQVTDTLLPRAFSLRQDTRIWIDSRNHWLVIDTGSSAKSDEVIGMLAKSIDPLPASMLHVATSPCAKMTAWLIEGQASDDFTIDQDAELASTGTGGGKIRYVRESIETDDAKKHIEVGKQCTKLALTWNDRISFVLTEGLDIKRVTALDVVNENHTTAENEQEQFDADFALMTGELNALLTSLIGALGGEKSIEANPEPDTAMELQEA